MIEINEILKKGGGEKMEKGINNINIILYRNSINIYKRKGSIFIYFYERNKWIGLDW